MTTLPTLSYTYTALEPYIDAQTMEIHYSKHHQTYVDKYNAVISKYPDLENKPVEDVLKTWTSLAIDEKDKLLIKNHGGGVANHNLYWSIMGSKKEIDQTLVDAITTTFGSLAAFKDQFTALAMNHFGSGWVWLVRKQDGSLGIYSLTNQDSPLSLGDEPVITIDLWEHAYYLKYQNRRAEYIAAWWNILKLIP